jgi:tripartite-type tricarboxylate transporter receptor subunit TctC
MVGKFISFCFFASLVVIAQPALAQGLSGKTVRIVVPYAAGGTGDVVARVLGQAVTQKTGQSIVVEDRPGASSIVGSEFAARAAPDGTTILLVENPFILSPILFPGHYDPITSFEPLCYVAATPAVLAVSSQSDIKTLADFLKLAKSKPGAVSYGSTGPGL